MQGVDNSVLYFRARREFESWLHYSLTLCKLLNLPALQFGFVLFFFLSNGDNNSIYFIGLL